jgi:hypothetical protein
MAKKIASLYAEIGADTTKLQQGLDDTKGRLTTFKEGLGNITRTIAGVTGAAAVMGATMQQIFAFGKAGAELEYAQGKFDNLSASIGTTSDALKNDLRSATKGLVADSELVASAGDFMALGLAKTHDEVVRLTRVAGALGMDMNQLVLTLTNQTTMRFDALGVSVDGFDEKVQKLKDSGMDAGAAFKEAFLQQAEEQIGKIGDKADSSVASFARMETAVKNAGDAIKMRFSQPIENAANAVATLLTWNEKVNGALQEHEGEVRTSAESWEDYIREVARAGVAAGKFNEEMAEQAVELALNHGEIWELKAIYGEAGVKINVASREMFGWTQAEKNGLLPAQDMNEVLSMRNVVLDEARLRTAEFAEKQREAREYQEMLTERQEKYTEAVERGYYKVQTYNDEVNRIKTTSDDAAEATDNLKVKLEGLDDIDPQFGNKIKTAIDQAKIALAGGAPIQEAIDQLLNYSATVDPEDEWAIGQIKTQLENAVVAAQEVQVEAGLISGDEAAQNISDTLGISLDEAKQRVIDIKDELGTFPKSIDVFINYIESGNRSSDPYNIKDDNDRGDTYANGGQFVIPPGYEDHSWPVGPGRYAESGETVTITPRGEGAVQPVNIYQYIYTQIDYEMAAAEIMERIRRNR